MFKSISIICLTEYGFLAAFSHIIIFLICAKTMINGSVGV